MELEKIVSSQGRITFNIFCTNRDDAELMKNIKSVTVAKEYDPTEIWLSVICQMDEN